MNSFKFRKLNANEIDCRVATVKRDGSGLSLILYSDARAVQAILDESVGPENWQRRHPNQNREFCVISIYDDQKDQWIEKEDVGKESFMEKEKGQASDSFKRAGVNWGIGRELHDVPEIWVNKPDCTTYESKGKFTSSDRFYVSKVDYTDGKITSLEIRNKRTGKVVYRLGEIEQQEPVVQDITFPDSGSLPMSEPKKKEIKALCKKYGVDVDMLYASNGLSENEVTEHQAGMILMSFKRKYGDE